MSVRHALLALLSEGPKIGLRLREEFEQRTGDVWPLNVGQVYATLQRLERDGLIESNAGDEGGQQKDYRITDAGRREVDDWLHTLPLRSLPVTSSSSRCSSLSEFRVSTSLPCSSSTVAGSSRRCRPIPV